MAKDNETKEGHTTLRIPNSTQKRIAAIAAKDRFKPKWTSVADQMLLEGCDQYEKKQEVESRIFIVNCSICGTAVIQENAFFSNKGAFCSEECLQKAKV
jgi:hypothetical protein